MKVKNFRPNAEMTLIWILVLSNALGPPGAQLAGDQYVRMRINATVDIGLVQCGVASWYYCSIVAYSRYNSYSAV